MHRIIAVSALWAVFAAFPLSGHAQTIVPSENRSAIELYLVLDPLQDENTAVFRWVDGRGRLVLHPSVGAFGLRSALRRLGRYARSDNPDWQPVDDPVVLPVDRPPHGYEREPAEYWDRLIAATPIEMKGHRVPVRVDSTRFGISKRRYQVPPVPPDTVPASFDEDAAFVSDGNMSQISTTILAVHFAYGATLAEKQEAVDLIAGRVIGGVAVGEGGIYYIQVEGDGTIATIDSIAAVLRALPTVASAYPERILPIGR